MQFVCISYITTQCQTPIFCTPLSSKTPTRLQPVGSLKVGRYISEFQHSLHVYYVKTYSYRRADTFQRCPVLPITWTLSWPLSHCWRSNSSEILHVIDLSLSLVLTVTVVSCRYGFPLSSGSGITGSNVPWSLSAVWSAWLLYSGYTDIKKILLSETLIQWFRT